VFTLVKNLKTSENGWKKKRWKKESSYSQNPWGVNFASYK
jgi:hypothetical protein